MNKVKATITHLILTVGLFTSVFAQPAKFTETDNDRTLHGAARVESSAPAPVFKRPAGGYQERGQTHGRRPNEHSLIFPAIQISSAEVWIANLYAIDGSNVYDAGGLEEVILPDGSEIIIDWGVLISDLAGLI